MRHCLFIAAVLLAAFARAAEPVDPRNITSGWKIPVENYCDQPYIVKTDDGAWLCVVTTGTGKEGEPGQHVISSRSTDQGRTWSKPVDIEPASGPEASYVVPLKAPGGRVFVFYNHNTDNVRQVKGDNPPFKDGWCKRVDCLGHFVFKYSDDHGRSWSAQRHDVPQRLMDIDRRNADAGNLLYFWTVGKAFGDAGRAFVPLHKVGGYGAGFFTRTEGVLLASDTLLSDRDPAAAKWITIPEGDWGLRAPRAGGPIAEEQSVTVLSDGSFYCVYRTIDGHPACAYSRDKGRTWSDPAYQAYADGRLMKHPRAANFVWRCDNGKYLYWFHNHGGRFIREHKQRAAFAYQGRNPAWICGGVEADSPQGRIILWSQPEILLYDPDPTVRMSYPDMIQDKGDYFFTETQKTIARVHRADKSLIEGLWTQFDPPGLTRDAVLLSTKGPVETDMPRLPDLSKPGGFSIELVVQIAEMKPDQVLIDSREPGKQAGLLLRVTETNSIELTLSDANASVRWDTEEGHLTPGKRHHVIFTVDGGPRIITTLVDGRLEDGGNQRQYGFGRWGDPRQPAIKDVSGSPRLRVDSAILGLKLHARPLKTSESVNNFRAL